jgi:DNA-binding transcriptional LysR family regulator
MHNAPQPLNALRFFEAAARHLSLTKAALELNVTRSRPSDPPEL